MAASTLFFVLVGIGVVSANVMKIVELLDTPHDSGRRRVRTVSNAAGDDVACQRAELRLESALYAA